MRAVVLLLCLALGATPAYAGFFPHLRCPSLLQAVYLAFGGHAPIQEPPPQLARILYLEDLVPVAAGSQGAVFEAWGVIHPTLPRIRVMAKRYEVDPDRGTPVEGSFVLQANAIREQHFYEQVYPGQNTLLKQDGVDWLVYPFRARGPKNPERAPTLDDYYETWRNQSLTPQQVTRVIGSALDAVEQMHERGVLHRDLKPEHFTVADDGTVGVLDFGVATLRGEKHARSVGTATYFSPAAWLNQETTEAVDVYALGLVLLEAENPGLFRSDSWHPAQRTRYENQPRDFIRLGQIPDEGNGTKRRRAIAHATMAKATVADYRKLLRLAPWPRAFRNEYARQWQRKYTSFTGGFTELLQDMLVFELYLMPAVGPTLLRGFPTATRRLIVGRGETKLREYAAGNGEAEFRQFGWFGGMEPQIELFLAHREAASYRSR